MITKEKEVGFLEKFRDEVISGLASEPKKMSSKYFYDEAGDKIFQQIMDSPEYYPTRSETEIFSQQTNELSNAISGDGEEFELIELGAGDAKKSTYLLKNLIERNARFSYLPIDISENIISYLTHTLPEILPGLNVTGYAGEYFEMLQKITADSNKRKVVLFLGSNIGNMDLEDAMDFCIVLRSYLNKGDMVLMGIDLKKNPKIILDAYNDKAGVTKRFNLNLLSRINRELNADFDIGSFEHFPTYNPENGACKSYLISLKDQVVTIGGTKIRFEKDEPIDMEISQKFTLAQTEKLAHNAGFIRKANFTDKNGWFLDTVWVAK